MSEISFIINTVLEGLANAINKKQTFSEMEKTPQNLLFVYNMNAYSYKTQRVDETPLDFI